MFMKVLKKCLKIFIILIGLFIVGNVFVYTYAKLSPKIEIKNANSFMLFDSNNEVFFQGSGSREWISLDDISPYLIEATINTEDKNFYKHIGFDYLRIIKAMAVNITSGTTSQGASTITQQYAKNLFLDFDKTWKRKWDEMWYTIEIESHYSKDEILEGYLNTINYGGKYGIETASKYYFGKSAKDLTLAEAAMLTGIPKSPSNYSPFVNLEKATQRQQMILKSMYDDGVISEAEYNKALDEELKFVGEEEEDELESVMYYQDAVIEELKSLKEIPESFLETGGLKVYTSLDMEAQKQFDSLNIHAPGIDFRVGNLSGGNQQKVVLAKWLMRDMDILFLDEPTRGIDVGAKTEIYKIMTKLAESGVSIVMISSELPELIAMSDRVYVLAEGELCGELKGEAITQEAIMSLISNKKKAI